MIVKFEVYGFTGGFDWLQFEISKEYDRLSGDFSKGSYLNNSNSSIGRLSISAINVDTEILEKAISNVLNGSATYKIKSKLNV